MTTTKQASLKPSKIWLVGGSQGIGLELTEKLLQKNHPIVVSSRNAEKSKELLILRKQYPKLLKLLDLDVTDNDDVSIKANQAWNMMNGIDTWIYNAGVYTPMNISEWNLEEFEEMNNVNYLGCLRILLALKDKFLNQECGHCLWNASLASDFGLPYGGGYSAPKAALVNLAEALQPELAKKNIKLQIINHGFVKTRLTAKNDFPMLGIMTADQAAEKIVRVLYQSNFETRFPFSLAFILKTLKTLPKSWALALTKKALKK